jgi:hypothetical protein
VASYVARQNKLGGKDATVVDRMLASVDLVGKCRMWAIRAQSRTYREDKMLETGVRRDVDRRWEHRLTKLTH